MSVEYINESKRMADLIVRSVHRGPGDTVDAAMHRAEREYGAPAKWLHRLRYRHDLRDMPVSAFFALLAAFMAVIKAGEKYEQEKALADARNSKVLWLADLVHGPQDLGSDRP